MGCSPDPMSKIIQSLKKTPFSIVHLGPDGIFRCLNWDRTILDAYPLTPELIDLFLTHGPDGRNKENLKIQQANMAGVDGMKVPRELWYNPPEEVRRKLPPPHSEEDGEEVAKMVEGDLEGFRVLQEKYDGECEEGKAEREAAGTL